MAISKVILNGVTQMDITDTTATAADVANGKVFYMASGLRTVGTASCGLTDDVKTALLNCFGHVAWIDDQGLTYYDALYNSLHGGLDSISAVYTQTETVYTTDSLDVLRSDLVVTATYEDGTTRTVTAYTLSGTLVSGTSTVTVNYFSATATFTVTVTDLAYITAVFTQPQTTIYTDASLDSLKSYLVVTYYTAPGGAGTVLADSAYTLSGTLVAGTSTVSVIYGIYTTTFNVTVVAKPLYDWNFKSSLVDTINGQTAVLTKNTNGTLPTRDSNGVHLSAFGQAIRLFGTTSTLEQTLKNRTLQVDVASFVPNSANNNYHTRFIMFSKNQWGLDTGQFDSGLIYRWNGSPAQWNIFAGEPDSYYGSWGSGFGITDRDAISGHTVSLYINSQYYPKLYIDGTSYGVANIPFYANYLSLFIGSNDVASGGATLYDAVITGARIYEGEVV